MNVGTWLVECEIFCACNRKMGLTYVRGFLEDKGLSMTNCCSFSLTGQAPKDTSKIETDLELQDSPGSDVPAHSLGQAGSRQKRKRPGSASDPGDDNSLDESGSGDHEETGERLSELARKAAMKEKTDVQVRSPYVCTGSPPVLAS
jgi:hypothetical protein